MMCKKVAYFSRSLAKRAAKTIKSAGKGTLRIDLKTPCNSLRPYLCPECGMWHLTSKKWRTHG